jgi:hypothetical protein
MSELKKLKEAYHAKCEVYSHRLLQGFLEKMGKLQAECKHKHTHWMQEINSDGSFKEGLFKRCLICGSTVDTFYTKIEFIENILNNFDERVEVQKKWLNK